MTLTRSPGSLRRGRDPYVVSVLLLLALVTLGFLSIGLGWRVVARTLVVAYQLPGLVSGAMGGLALLAVGAALLSAQTSRWVAAQEGTELQGVLDEAAATVAAARARRRQVGQGHVAP